MKNSLQIIAEQIKQEAPYTGGPIKDFERVGRDTFIKLLQNGLRPDHTILDFGCGSLRLGYWIVRFMNTGKYYGIEPEKKMLEPGKKYSLTEEIINLKQPTFSCNSSCDFSVFGVKFDFVVSRSILTHTTPGMFRKIIKSFKENGSEQAVMLASYWPLQSKPDGENGDNLDLNDWRFIKVVEYNFNTIQLWSEEFGINVSEFRSPPVINKQIWLKFEKST